ncbi:MAG: bifunctional anthranilate synthase component II/anthranilate phosphoribosyltransferase [Lachnospiraceae bacterium]|nr:bifunctional anthranilate synthase component II/anthranilate phosphoribosyltransferase [Lachnospiraceae bacterium]
MILLIDNYDSFSYNVYQMVGAIEPNVKVIRNDEMTVEEIEKLAPDHIIMSPGPGRPADAGICESVVKTFAGRIPILGICLGHQAICEALGGKIGYAKELMHGKQSVAKIDTASKLFAGMHEEMTVGRYHSLSAEEEALPECLKVTARTADGEIMAVEHVSAPVYGVQFHPESILTPEGNRVLENFLGKGNATVKAAPAEEKKASADMIKKAIILLSKKENIGYDMAKAVMNEIMDGNTSEVQKSAYLTALSMKGETIEEITGSAEAMRDHSLKLHADRPTLEIVGTGGDNANSFNISTTSAMVIAAAGVPVTKHGNRAASSKSGAADCLEALGANITIEPEKSIEVLNEAGICFLFAQKYHSAMKYVGPIRKELGIRTIFNILGPLTNPACPSMIVLGVYEEALLEPLAKVLSNLGIQRGLVVFGREKLDEISAVGETAVCEIDHGSFKKYVITPEDMGLEHCGQKDLLGGTPAENAEITKAVLRGEEKGGKRTAVLMNAGAALFVAGKAASLKEGVELAAKTIDNGDAYKKMEEFVTLTNK